MNTHHTIFFQASTVIKIPKEHHRFILGPKGKNLSELELNTATKISIPRQEEKSDDIKIVGTKEGIEKARHEIQVISDEQVRGELECQKKGTCPIFIKYNIISTGFLTEQFNFFFRPNLHLRDFPSLKFSIHLCVVPISPLLRSWWNAQRLASLYPHSLSWRMRLSCQERKKVYRYVFRESCRSTLKR